MTICWKTGTISGVFSKKGILFFFITMRKFLQFLTRHYLEISLLLVGVCLVLKWQEVWTGWWIDGINVATPLFFWNS